MVVVKDHGVVTMESEPPVIIQKDYGAFPHHAKELLQFDLKIVIS